MTPTLKENGRADGMMLSCRGKAANLGVCVSAASRR